MSHFLICESLTIPKSIIVIPEVITTKCKWTVIVTENVTLNKNNNCSLRMDIHNGSQRKQKPCVLMSLGSSVPLSLLHVQNDMSCSTSSLIAGLVYNNASYN